MELESIAPAGCFGCAVEIAADLIAIGDPSHDGNGNNSGAAFVYRRRGLNWAFEATLSPEDAAPEDLFGGSIALWGDTIFIGADHASGDFLGAVYVFENMAGVWVQSQKLLPIGPDPSGQFGSSLAVSGSTLLVGAPAETDQFFGSGAAYTVDYDGISWTVSQRLTASPQSLTAQFGSAVAIQQNIAVIGALTEDALGNGSGAAYVFKRSQGSWNQDHRLVPADGQELNGFGSPIAFAADWTVLIGTSGVEAPDRVYVYDVLTGEQVASIEASDGTSEDGFGIAIDTDSDGRRALIGAPGASMDAGKGYLFELVGAAWNEVDQLVSDDPEDERFGHEVALVAGLAVIGSGPAPGAMHVLRLDCLGTSYCAPTPNSTGSPGHLVAFGDPNPAKDNLTLVASQLPSQANIGYFIAGQGSNVHLPPGAAGPICIGGGSILRFLPPVSNTAELAGGFERNVGAFAPQWSQITTGSSWNFQAWHRDGTSPSNFTDAVNIVFR